MYKKPLIIYNSSGRPVSGNDLVRFLLSLIQWASEGWRYEGLKNVILNPLFVIPVQAAGQEEGNAQRAINGLQEFLKGIDDRIGWGLGRYKRFIEKSLQTGEQKEYSVAHSAEYLGFLQDAVGIFDGIKAPADPAALLAAMIDFAGKYTRRKKDSGIILPLLEKERRELSYMLPPESLKETLDILKDRLENMSAGEPEDPFAVAACRISGVEILDRPYIYVIGLADRHYGTALIESPVLNDLEREKYLDLASGNVTLSRDRAGRRLENYEASLELSEAVEIHLGFCCFDTVKQETLSPSSLFLDLREKYGAGIKTLPVAEYPGVISEDTFVDYETVWGSDAPVLAADKEQAVVNAGKEGSDSSEQRTDKDSSGNVTERSLFFSSSSLDTFLACPAKYNYQKLRRIPEEDYTVPDSGIWLNPADKGTYFHLILQDYIEQRFVGRDSISPEMDRDLFEEIFRSATEKTLDLVPVESPAVARQEQEEVRDAAVRYLTELHQEFSDPVNPWQVLACEKPFGRAGVSGLQLDFEYIPPTGADSFGVEKPGACPEAPDPSGDDEDAVSSDLFHLTFSGIIDRLDGYTDADGKKHFRIVDYKTGSFENFKKYKLEDKKRNPTTQHTIYQMYVSQSGSVDAFEYHFPFEEKDEDRKIRIRDFGDLLHDDDILECLHDAFVLDDFSPEPKTGGCNYCKYSDICLTKIL